MRPAAHDRRVNHGEALRVPTVPIRAEGSAGAAVAADLGAAGLDADADTGLHRRTRI